MYADVLENFTLRTILYFILFSLLGFHFCQKQRRNRRHVEFAKNIPGPKDLPIVGNGLTLYLHKKDSLSNLFAKYATEYGSKFRLWIGKHLFVVLTDVEDIKTVLFDYHALGKPKIYENAFFDMFGPSLIFSDVDKWEKSRRCIQPFFLNNFDRLLLQTSRMTISRYANKLNYITNGQEYNLNTWIFNMYFDIFTKIFINVELTDAEKKSLKFKKTVEKAAIIGYLRTMRPWLHSKFVADFVYGMECTHIRNKFLKFVKKVQISEIVKVRSLCDSNEDTGETISAHFLSCLYQDAENQQMNDLPGHHVINFMAASTFTTSATISFFLLVIATKPEIQDKLYNEIFRHFGNSERPVFVSDLEKLLYLDQVLKEVLRRYPVIPSVCRRLVEDTKIGDVIYPAGTALYLNLASVHFDPTMYPNPYAFDPENFSYEAVTKRPNYSFLPFAAGSRNCIGKEYAQMTIKLAVITLLRNFSFKTSLKFEEIRQKQGFVTYSERGCPVSVQSRRK